jgi:hypothetical protein
MFLRAYASAERRHGDGAVLVAYGVGYFFTEFGPNTTTFVYPAEIFPVEVRTTAGAAPAGPRWRQLAPPPVRGPGVTENAARMEVRRARK